MKVAPEVPVYKIFEGPVCRGLDPEGRIPGPVDQTEGRSLGAQDLPRSDDNYVVEDETSMTPVTTRSLFSP